MSKKEDESPGLMFYVFVVVVSFVIGMAISHIENKIKDGGQVCQT